MSIYFNDQEAFRKRDREVGAFVAEKGLVKELEP